MKRNFLVKLILFIYFAPFILAIFSSIFFSEESTLNPFDYARITDVDYKAVVVDEPDSNGKILVTERLTFDIHAASEDNPFWELWRDLPEDYVDGVKVDYKVNSVKQILDDGSEVIFDESPKLYWDDEDYVDTEYGYGPEKWYHSEGPYNEDARQYECVLLYVDGLYREKVTFEIEYEMNNAALRYNDCSELYLCMYSEETINHLNSFSGQILIPNKDMPTNGNYEAHTYGTNSNSFPFEESTTTNPGYHTFSFDLDKNDLKFKPYNEYIEFSLVSFGKDKHAFTEYASINDYYFDDVLEELRDEQKKYDKLPEKAAVTKLLILILCFVAGFLLIKILLKTDDKIEQKYNFYKPTMEMKYFRDIPSNLDPLFATSLAFCKDPKNKDPKDGYAALMLSLVRKGYVELKRIDEEKDWKFNNVKIIVKYNPKAVIPTDTYFYNTSTSLSYNPISSVSDSPLNNIDSLSNETTLNTSDYLSANPLLNNTQSNSESIFNSTIDSETKKLEPLTHTEELYFNLIIRHSSGKEISMKDFQSRISLDYDNTNSFVKNIEDSTTTIGVSQGYFQKAFYKQPQVELAGKSVLYGILSFIFIVIINILSYKTRLELAYGGYFFLGFAFAFGSIHLKKLSKKYLLLTQFGEDEYVKWKGLYEFLNSETLMNERTVVELPIWEQYLVYATAFGISDKVISALNIRCPEASSSEILSNPYYRSNNFYSSHRTIRTTSHQVSYSVRSGSYGGHGGYGGGGRGGGGGGGGH